MADRPGEFDGGSDRNARTNRRPTPVSRRGRGQTENVEPHSIWWHKRKPHPDRGVPASARIPAPYSLPKPLSCTNTITRPPAPGGTSVFWAKPASLLTAPILRKLREGKKNGGSSGGAERPPSGSIASRCEGHQRKTVRRSPVRLRG